MIDYHRVIIYHVFFQNLIKSTWIVGQSSPDHSLTINEQQKRLKQFCEGSFLFYHLFSRV